MKRQEMNDVHEDKDDDDEKDDKSRRLATDAKGTNLSYLQGIVNANRVSSKAPLNMSPEAKESFSKKFNLRGNYSECITEVFEKP